MQIFASHKNVITERFQNLFSVHFFCLKISPNGCRPAKSGNYIKLKFVENVLRFLEHFEFLTLRICLCTNWLEVQSS